MIVVPTYTDQAPGRLTVDIHINWFQVFFTTLDTATELAELIRGTDMNSDLVPLAAILLFAGGLLFWFFMLVMILTGIYRGIWKTIVWVSNKPQGRSGGSMPQHD